MTEDIISAEMLAKAIKEKQNFFLLDVRNPEEHQHYNIGGHLIPLSELALRLHEIPKMPIVVYCRSGHRSGLAQSFLKEAGFEDVKNLSGGVLAWESNNPL